MTPFIKKKKALSVRKGHFIVLVHILLKKVNWMLCNAPCMACKSVMGGGGWNDREKMRSDIFAFSASLPFLQEEVHEVQHLTHTARLRGVCGAVRELLGGYQGTINIRSQQRMCACMGW